MILCHQRFDLDIEKYNRMHDIKHQKNSICEIQPQLCDTLTQAEKIFHLNEPVIVIFAILLMFRYNIAYMIKNDLTQQNKKRKNC